MRTTTSQQKQCKWWDHLCSRSWRTPEEGNPERCCFTGGGEAGCADTFLGTVSLHAHQKACQQKPAERKMTRENTTKIGASEDHWLQCHLAAPFFTKPGFQLSRLRCEISMNVFRGHNHKTTLKPGYITKIGILRGFEDKFGWRKLRPNHGVQNGPRARAKTVPVCCAT